MATITSETPSEKDEWYTRWYQCPECKSGFDWQGKTIESKHIAPGFKFCPDCGTKIEWALTDNPNAVDSGA